MHVIDWVIPLKNITLQFYNQLNSMIKNFILLKVNMQYSSIDFCRDHFNVNIIQELRGHSLFIFIENERDNGELLYKGYW